MKLRLALLAAMVVVVAACSPYTNEAGPTIPPHVDGMVWADTPEDANQCGIGLMADGTVAVVSAFNIPAGMVADWLAWSVDLSPGPPGYSLVDCWNVSQWNWSRAFNLYVHCYGGPRLRTTWTDYGAASAWVQVPFCQCNAACQWRSGALAPFFRQNTAQCSWDFLYFRCNPGFGNHATGALSALDTVGDPPTTVADNGLASDGDAQPLPGDWQPPDWDVNAVPGG